MKRLLKMEADYGDVIPRREYEDIKAEHDQLVIAHEEMSTDYVKNKQELTLNII